MHESTYSGCRILPCGRTDRQTDMTKLIVAFRNFVKTSKTFDKTMCNINPLYTQKAVVLELQRTVHA
jgi:hypothetical protein